MTTSLNLDVAHARRLAGKLREAAEDLEKQRPQLLERLANGDGIRPAVKVKDDVKVTIGIPPYEHPGSRAGEVIAQKIRSCGDAYTAVEDGLRAMATVMSRMVENLDDGDKLTGEQLNTVLSGLYCVARVNKGEEPESVDWFGLEAA